VSVVACTQFSAAFFLVVAIFRSAFESLIEGVQVALLPVKIVVRA
jgi:hypothetical protein